MKFNYYNEFDPAAAEWLRELIKAGLIAPGEVDERSILDVRADDLLGFAQCHFFAGIGGWSYALRLAGWPDDRPVWTGSPPCQPFSVAGEGLSQDDPRHLAPHFIRLVRDARPAVLFGEQVASSAVFGKAAGKAKRGPTKAPEWAWIDDLSDRLEAAQYAVGASDIPAAGVEAPNIRQRTFFGAYDLRSATGGVGDGIGTGLEGHGRNVQHRDEPGRIDAKSNGPAGAAGAFDRLADTSGAGIRNQRPETDAGAKKGMRQASQQRQRLWHDVRTNDGFGVLRTPATSPPDNPWSDADWLFCWDGKWRPVEPGTFPLAHGLSGRVGLLRGYGNAINPWAAKEFIETFEEVMRGV